MADVEVTTQVTDLGLAAFAYAMLNEAENVYMHWGTGTNNLDPERNNLVTPATEDRVLVAVTNPSNGVLNFNGTMECNSTGKTITEVGIFDAETGGNLLIVGSLSKAVTEGDTIEFDLTATFARPS